MQNIFFRAVPIFLYSNWIIVFQIPVPRQAVGIVIGKGGEMIKKIQSETGARVQFKPDDGQSPDRICSIAGPPDKTDQAASMIQDLLNSTNVSIF